MSLPPGFLDELRNRVSMGQVAGRKVMWDARKSNQGKGDLWAPCPFHQEKTASFHVDDRKGYYYCFGCHAKGDAISFVRETENVGFMEAVEILAGEAGMPMPARDPKAQEKADERTELSKVMEMAVQFFRLQLKTGAGAAAYRYLADKRGLSDDAIGRWELGFAPDGWQGLWDHLTGKGVPEDKILACGLAKASDKGRKPYDTFRNRIMFPIRDARGRCIAFGGRAMDPNDNAKYLNSPETLLFDKGRSLYNHAPAREASGKGDPIIVAEGYMDVIALSEAGFKATVAPLGTAVTEAQLELLWRMSEEPVIALDGDKAGIRAAHRVIDLAMPLLAAGKGLRFALMPDGKDPDDVIKSGGADAMQEVLAEAQPMVSLLWQRETEGRVFDSPERRAALDKTLREKLKLIQDPSLRGHYGEEIKRLRAELFGYGQSRPIQRGEFRRPRGKWQPAAGPQQTTRNSFLAQQEGAESALREAVILATVAATPAVLSEFEVELEDLECAGDRAILRDALLRIDDPSVADDVLSAHGAMPALESLRALPHVAITPAVRTPGDMELARLCLAEEFAKLAARMGHAKEVAEAIEDIDGLVDEGLTWRLSQAAQALQSAGRQDDEDTTEYDTAPNGARLSKDERSSFDELLDGIKFSKSKGRG
ncbi:DNA primase [Shimia ponticola]|uniref:DNA primase n=1 Tax=Shimia ponticola TaxID=2582893 RepID=UPI0011BD80B1|nr:DNA primase [Shimia ponticola]